MVGAEEHSMLGAETFHNITSRRLKAPDCGGRCVDCWQEFREAVCRWDQAGSRQRQTSKTSVSSETHAQSTVRGNSMLLNLDLHLRGSQLPPGLLGGPPPLLSPPPPLLPPPATLPPPMPPPPETACSNE